MSSPSLRDLCLDHLLATADRFLDLQWSDGRFEIDPEHETEDWNSIPPAVPLRWPRCSTRTDHPANPWRDNERLWQALLRHGQYLVTHVNADGAMLWNLTGANFLFVDQRLVCAWLLGYELLEDRLPEADTERVARDHSAGV